MWKTWRVWQVRNVKHITSAIQCFKHHITVMIVWPSMCGQRCQTFNLVLLTKHSSLNDRMVTTCTSNFTLLPRTQTSEWQGASPHRLNLDKLTQVMHLKSTHHTNPGYLASVSKDVSDTFLVAGGVVAVLDEWRQQLLVPGGWWRGTPLSVYGAEATQQHLGVCASTPSTCACFQLCVCDDGGEELEVNITHLTFSAKHLRQLTDNLHEWMDKCKNITFYFQR